MQSAERLDWPLMEDNITHADKVALMEFLGGDRVPRMTNGPRVAQFEEEFAQWLGTKYAVMVNSGSSANILTLLALRILYGPQKVMVPCIGWVSDIAAVLLAGHEPQFIDVDPRTLGMNMWDAAKSDARACLVVHCLGFPAVKDWHSDKILIEDACEALGATQGRGLKLGTLGLMSNFSFYYAHHMSTIEGGMVCTNDERCYELLRMLRAHGLVREMKNQMYRKAAEDAAPDCSPDFIFSHLAYNMRPIELSGVLGSAQLPRVEYGAAKRTANLVDFLFCLDNSKYRIEYALKGSSNYALPLVLKHADAALFQRVTACLRELGVEYRKGTAGGGNQLRQPYARERWGEHYKDFPEAEHIHHYGLYIGNYPTLDPRKIKILCERLNAL